MHLLLDIGGTYTRLSTATNGSFTPPVKFPTEPDFTAAMSTISARVRQIFPASQFESTIVGLPGVMNQATGRLASSPNLPAWINQPILDQLQDITHAPVRIVNDAALAGLGEACYGAGQGYDIVAYLTISTGVGGARVVQQQIDVSTYGFEPGFHLVDASGGLCPDCHHPSSLEDLVGGASTAKRFGQHPKAIKDPLVWSTLAKWLAYGLTNITALWSPAVIVLGGPMMKDIPLDLVIKHTAQLTSFLPAPPAIKLAALADDRAFYGALALLKSNAK